MIDSLKGRMAGSQRRKAGGAGTVARPLELLSGNLRVLLSFGSRILAYGHPPTVETWRLQAVAEPEVPSPLELVPATKYQ
jgi:hypothetical protein